MTKRKWTPAPWWACFDADQPWPTYPGLICYLAVAPGYEIAVVTGPAGDKSGSTQTRKEEWPANAHLIAAAPDLYEALEMARSFMADVGCQDTPNYPHMQAVCAALAKARGES